MGLLDLFRAERTAPRERIEPYFNPVASLENPAVNLSQADGTWFADWAAGGSASFGPPVNPRTALTVSAVYRAVTLRAGVVAGLPLKVYERTPTGRREATDHRLARVFKVAPNPGQVMTAFVWFEHLVGCIDLWGNAYAAIRYDGAGRIVAIEPYEPQAIEMVRRAGRSLYICTREDGSREVVDQADMLHFVGPNVERWKGLSRIQAFARDPIALAKVLEEQTGRVHENAARPSGILSVPPGIQPEGMKRLKQQFGDQYMGRPNAGKVIFADKDTTFTPIQLSPDDLTTIESRRFQVAEIARIFGVPLHLLQETDKATSWGSGLAEQNLAWLCYSLNADLGRIEAEINYKLLDGTNYYAEFHRTALLEMDPVKASEVQQKQIASGVLLINEARAMQNRPPVEGGDRPFINSTNVPLDRQLAASAPSQPGAPPNA